MHSLPSLLGCLLATVLITALVWDWCRHPALDASQGALPATEGSEAVESPTGSRQWSTGGQDVRRAGAVESPLQHVGPLTA